MSEDGKQRKQRKQRKDGKESVPVAAATIDDMTEQNASERQEPAHPGAGDELLASERRARQALDEFFVDEEEWARIGTLRASEISTPGAGRVQDAAELLAFWVADEEYAAEIVDIQEIIKVPEITMVPRAPACMLGIISLRGTIVPVIELRALLHLPSTEVSRDSRVLVLRGEGESAGLLVDRVSSVVRFGRDTVEEVPRTMRQPAVELLAGVAREGDRMLILLDLAAVLNAIEVAA